MPSNIIKKALLSSVSVHPHLHGKDPFSSLLNQMTNPSLSQSSTFIRSFCLLRKIKKAPDISSPGNNSSTTLLNPSKLLRIFMGCWQRKSRALPGIVNIMLLLKLSDTLSRAVDHGTDQGITEYHCAQRIAEIYFYSAAQRKKLLSIQLAAVVCSSIIKMVWRDVVFFTPLLNR